MRSVKKRLLKGSACLPLIVVALSGCATVDSGPAIKAGDTVGVHFTCRLPNSAIAISTEKDVAADPLLPKAPYFLPRVSDGTLEVVAGRSEAAPGKLVKGFESDVTEGITAGLPGMRAGEGRTLELASSASDNKELRLARVRHALKEKVVSVDEFKDHTHKDPVKGETVQFEDSLPGVVKEIKDGKVTLTFSATGATAVNTPFGPGKVRDAGNQYEIVIDVKQGDLMRIGPLVGRVKSVDEREFVLDFSRTFGGDNLRCDVKVETVRPAAEHGSAAPTAAAPAPPADAATAKPQKTDAASPETRQGTALLQKAVADAAKDGKKSVSMDMDTLFQVARGDLATVRFTTENPDGSPLLLPEGSAKPGVPQEVIAGKDDVFPGLGDAVIGMAAGEKKQITLPPEKAFGPRNPANTANFPLKTTTPATLTLPAEEYVKRFGGFPAPGKEVPLFPYMTTKVANIGEKDVTLSVSAKNGENFNEPFGTVTTSVGKDGITVRLDPKVGAPFNTGDKQGVISGSNGDTFTVDFNHPLAGKTIVLKLEVASVTKAADLKAAPIHWIENHDDGLAEAKKEGKPLFLLLYAEWCHWCQKTQSETLTDPRIERLQDKFVWMRLNSDKEKKYKQEFGQDGFPMMVILSPDGTVLKKIDGYRNAAALKTELDGVL